MCEQYGLELKMSEARVAAAYAQLALLENFRRSARLREQKQRNEGLPRPAKARYMTHNQIGVKMSDGHHQDTSLDVGRYLKVRYRPLSPDHLWLPTWTQQMTLCDPHALKSVKNSADTRLHDHRRACSAIAELHQQLLNERASRRQIHSAALCAGVRAAHAAKHLARKALTNACTERLLARRDALLEAREHVLLSNLYAVIIAASVGGIW